MNREWINYIDSNLCEVFPIQLANCDRLVYNDVIYLFDEVGSGKTISSGLMALDYLYNNRDKKVLIITENSLVKNSSDRNFGQFLSDWFDKLPFFALDLYLNIDIINNHAENIRRKECIDEPYNKKNCNYGLIIIDEAHKFLNKETDRFKNVIKLKSDKIVFLTATPIKSNKDDLKIYTNIAKEILNKSDTDIDTEWIDILNTKDNNKEYKQKNEIICSIFDEKIPVTRYFKDTIKSINFDDKRNSPTRLLPQLWKYNSLQTKKETLLKNLNEAICENSENRFIIFTRFVENEAYDIEKYLCSNGFEKYTDENSDILKSVKVVTGKNSHELKKYSGFVNLPRVLILTYQIAEQGVNLPGFNYVVNYHIPSSPASLEQRFGRIDRMDSKSSQIYITFLILDENKINDINTINFYIAVSIYMNNLISYLPSKNTILSEDIINNFKNKKNIVQEYVNLIKSLIKDYKRLQNIKDYVLLSSTEKCNKKDCNQEILEFIEVQNIKIEKGSTIEEIYKKIIKRLNDLTYNFDKITEQNIDICFNIINKAGDKIFYGDEDCLNIISASASNDEEKYNEVKTCVDFIKENEIFSIYREKVLKTMNNIKNLQTIFNGDDLVNINKYFENCFLNNEIEKIFPNDGYKNILIELLKYNEIINFTDDEIKAFIFKLPFFKMYSTYNYFLCTRIENIYLKYQSPFYDALKDTFDVDCYGKINSTFNLSKEFIDNVSKIFIYDTKENSLNFPFYLLYNGEYIEASNWYKLAYQCTKFDQNKYFFLYYLNVHYKPQDRDEYNNKYISKISYFRFSHIIDGKLDKYSDKYNDNGILELNNKIYSCKSDFRSFIQAQHKIRNLNDELVSMCCPPCKIIKDKWTKGILSEIHAINKE